MRRADPEARILKPVVWLAQLGVGLLLTGLAGLLQAWLTMRDAGGDADIGSALPAPGSGEPVVAYTLRARLDEVAHTVHGEGTVVWRNGSRVAQGEIYLHLYLNAFRDERTVFMREGERIRGFRGSAT